LVSPSFSTTIGSARDPSNGRLALTCSDRRRPGTDIGLVPAKTAARDAPGARRAVLRFPVRSAQQQGNTACLGAHANLRHPTHPHLLDPMTARTRNHRPTPDACRGPLCRTLAAYWRERGRA